MKLLSVTARRSLAERYDHIAQSAAQISRPLDRVPLVQRFPATAGYRSAADERFR